MAKQTIDQGTPPAGTDGDTVRTAFAKVNANFDELYLRAQGKLTKSIAGGAGTVALTAAEALNGIIDLTGVITGDKIVTVPATPTMAWAVRNSTSGNFAVSFRTAAGTGGVTVPQGRAMLVASDGTNVIDLTSDKLSISGGTVFGPAAFSQRPVFGTGTPWDSGNLPRPVTVSSINNFQLEWSPDHSSVRLTIDGSQMGSLVRGEGGGGNHRVNWNGSGLQWFVDNTNIGTVAMTSDYRIKHSVADYSGGLAVIKSVRTVLFRFKDIGIFSDDGLERAGFLAHEAAGIPGAVVGEKDAVREDGTIIPQTLNPIPLIAALWSGLQDAADMIDALKRRVEKLEAAST